MTQNDSPERSLPALWPLRLSTIWFILPLAGVIFGASIQPISPHDYWWHLVMGRYISATGSLPDANLFLYTMDAGAAFLDQPWLAQLMMFELREITGDVGLIWTRNLLVAASWAVLMRLALRRTMDLRVVGVVALAAVLLSGRAYGVRTQIFALLPYAVLLWVIVELASRRWSWRGALVLLPLTALWANLHGSFALVPALVLLAGISCLGQAWLRGEPLVGIARRWSVALAGALVGGTLTPHGPLVYAYVAELSVTSTVAQTVTEWQSPAWNTFYGVALLAAILVGGGLLAWRRREVDLWEVALFGATAYLAADALRNFYWFASVFVVVLAPHVAAVWRTERAREGSGSAAINALLAIAVVLLPLSVQPASPAYSKLVLTLNPEARRAQPGAALYTVDTPMRLAAMIDERGIDGRLFHAQEVGGLVEFILAPAEGEQVAFVDQRMELIPEEVWAAYFKISEAGPGWESELRDRGVDAALLSLEHQPGLVDAMSGSDAWVRVAEDSAHVLFIEAGSEQLTRWR